MKVLILSTMIISQKVNEMSELLLYKQHKTNLYNMVYLYTFKMAYYVTRCCTTNCI